MVTKIGNNRLYRKKKAGNGRLTAPQAALQAVFDKRKACLDEKRSRFNRFRTCF